MIIFSMGPLPVAYIVPPRHGHYGFSHADAAVMEILPRRRRYSTRLDAAIDTIMMLPFGRLAALA